MSKPNYNYQLIHFNNLHQYDQSTRIKRKQKLKYNAKRKHKQMGVQSENRVQLETHRKVQQGGPLQLCC